MVSWLVPQFLGTLLGGKIWYQCVVEENVNFNIGRRSRRKKRGESGEQSQQRRIKNVSKGEIIRIEEEH